MEKNPRYFLVGGTGELTEETTSEKLPNLSDKDIDKLYSKLIKLDGKYKNFKGSKRDYCFTVSGLIINFLKGNNLLGKEGGKLTDEEKAKKAADKEAEQVKKEALLKAKELLQNVKNSKKEKKKENLDAAEGAYNNLTETERKEFDADFFKDYITLKKEGDKTLTKQDIEIIFGKDFFENLKNFIPGSVTENVKTPPYKGLYLEKTQEIKNPKKLYPDYKDITIDQILDHAKKYKKVIELFCDSSGNYDMVSTKNFLLLTPFTEIFNDTEEGNKQKERYREIMVKLDRGTGYPATPNWSKSDSATLEIENDYYFRYLKNKGFHLKDKDGKNLSDDMARVALSGKIFSKGESSKNIDYSNNLITEELKGNTAKLEVQDISCTVDLSKVLAGLLDMFYIKKGDIREKPKKGEISFYQYTSNDDILKTKQSHLCTIGFDLNKFYNSFSGESKMAFKKILEKVSKKDLTQFNDIFTFNKDILKNKEDQQVIKEEIFKYFGVKTDTGKKGEINQGDIGKSVTNQSTGEQKYMFDFNLTKPVIREKFYIKELNSSLGLDTTKPLESLVDFFQDRDKLFEYEAFLEKDKKNPTDVNYIELKEPEESKYPEPDDLEERFVNIATLLLDDIKEDNKLTDLEYKELINKLYNDKQPKSYDDSTKIITDYYNSWKAEKEQTEKKQTEKEQAKKELEEKKDKVIEQYKEVEQLYNQKNSPIITPYEIKDIDEKINKLLERNKKTIKRILKKDPEYKPPEEPEEPEDFDYSGEGKKGFGRRFYFKRF